MNRHRTTVLCVTIALLAGCKGGDDGKTPQAGDDIAIAWIPKEQGNQVFQTGLDGARLKARELTDTTDHDVSILYDEIDIPATAGDVDAQAASVRKAVDAGADLIAISCSGTSVSAAVDEAVAAGVPVMSWDSDCLDPADNSPSDRFTYFGIDNYETGRTAANLLTSLLTQEGTPKPWNVGILTGVPSSSNLQERTAGMWTELKAQSVCARSYDAGTDSWPVRKCWSGGVEFTGDPATVDFHVYEDRPGLCTPNPFDAVDQDACATDFCFQEPDIGLESSACAPIMDALTTRTRDGATLDGFLLVGLWPTLGYYDASATTAADLAGYVARMSDPSDGLVAVTYDTLPYQLDMLQEGLFDALIGQKYWAWGYEVSQMGYDYLVDDKTFDPLFVDSGADIVCGDNVAEMAQLWSSGDFTQEISDCLLLP